MEKEQNFTTATGPTEVPLTYEKRDVDYLREIFEKEVAHLKEIISEKENAVVDRLNKLESGEIRRQDTRNQWKLTIFNAILVLLGWVLGLLTHYVIPL